MQTGALGSYLDVAQIVLYAFWIFFAGLIYYLHRENKREGYPLETDRRSARVRVEGFPAVPAPKTFLLPHGGTATVPNAQADRGEIKAVPTSGAPGSPLEPTGNPMLDGVGPAAYAERADTPDLTYEGDPKIVPLRAAADHYLERRDPDPRGMPVIGADGASAGTVRDAWVDRSEALVRYLEVEVAGGRRVLLPINFARIRNGRVSVKAILAHHFADVPATKHPDEVTLREEDRICAYYGGGTLYAEPSRAEPLI